MSILTPFVQRREPPTHKAVAATVDTNRLVVVPQRAPDKPRVVDIAPIKPARRPAVRVTFLSPTGMKWQQHRLLGRPFQVPGASTARGRMSPLARTANVDRNRPRGPWAD